jgi:hypothetical protein
MTRAEWPPGEEPGAFPGAGPVTTTDQLDSLRQTARHAHNIATAAGRGDHLGGA